MAVLVPSKGCVYRPVRRGGVGSYAIDGLSVGSPDTPVLIVGGDLRDQDVTLPVTTLNKLKILYTFGEGFGDAAIQGVALLGPGGRGDMERVISWFQRSRVTAGGKGVNFSFPGGAYRIYVTSLGLAAPDTEYHIQPFVIYGYIAQPS